MADLELEQSTQFVVSDLRLVTKVGYFDIIDKFEELNIFDSVMNSVMSGNILLRDATNLSSTLSFDGSESILITIGKDADSLKLKKSFRIYKQSNRVAMNQSSEMFVLHFISDEFIFSMQQRVSQYFAGTYTDIVKSIMSDYLLIPQSKMTGFMDKSFGVKKTIIPNIPPLSAIEWCANRAIDSQRLPNFMFFENIAGFNFASLNSLMSLSPIAKINFDPKNLSSEISPDIRNEILGARSFEIISQYDFIENTLAGVYAGTLVAYNPATRTVVEKPFNFNDIYKDNKHGNVTPNIGVVNNRAGLKNTQMYGSRRIISVFEYDSQNSDWIQENDPESLSSQDDTENYMFQRKAILQNLFGKRIKMTLPGNFALASGFCVDVQVPVKGIVPDGEENVDRSTYGKYLIIGARHIIKPNMHEVVIEAVTDSSNINPNGEAVYESSKIQDGASYY